MAASSTTRADARRPRDGLGRDVPDLVRSTLARVASGEPLGRAAGVTSRQRDALYAVGHAALTAGRLREARDALALLVALEPDVPRAWAALAIAVERAGDLPNAAAFYAVAGSIEATARWWLRSAACSAAAGARSNAASAARKVLETSRSSPLERQRALLLIDEVGHADGAKSGG